MKIFNWVHRKFQHKDGFLRDVKKDEFINNDDAADTHALLKHEALADLLNGWKEGILTIGTFGYDPLKEFPASDKQEDGGNDDDDEEDEEEEMQDYSIEDSDSDDIEMEDEGEMNPLVCTAIRHGFEEEFIGSSEGTSASKAKFTTSIDVSQRAPLDQLGFDNDKQKKKGERITLADLFSADSDGPTKLVPGKFQSDIGKKHDPHAKSGLSFAKKFIPLVKEDSRPIRKLHSLMKRMLKRKIHPDLEEKIQKMDNKGHVGKDYQEDESESLLRTQGVVV